MRRTARRIKEAGFPQLTTIQGFNFSRNLRISGARIVLDKLGYLPLGPQSAQLLFQAIAESSERKATIITTNLPFSDWTSIFPDQRLCRALVERVTHRAYVLESETNPSASKRPAGRPRPKGRR